MRRGGGGCYLVLVGIVKICIVFLCIFGTFSVLSQVFRGVLRFDVSDSREEDVSGRTATEDRRDRVYEERRIHSLSVCQNYEEEITLHTVKMYDLVPPAPIGLNADILVDRRRQFYWCKVPKAASTSWISLLLSDREFSKMKVSIGKQHMYLRKLMPPATTIDELLEIQQKFFSFMTVRHPFERVLSAYRDKFFALTESTNEKNKAAKFHRMYGKMIIQKFRLANDSFAQDPKHKGIPTFPEFVDYLLSTDVEMYNEHWLPYYLLCTPCHLNYTVIAKTEDISDDSRYILDVLKMHGLSQSLAQKETLVKIHQTGRKSSSATSREYYMQLNKEQVKGLYDKYEIDMEMFNYVIEPYLSYAVNTLPPKYAPKQDQINQ